MTNPGRQERFIDAFEIAVVVTRSGSVAVAPSYASSDVISRAYLRFL